MYCYIESEVYCDIYMYSPCVTQTLVLSYAYHCCEFLPLAEGGGEPSPEDDAGVTDYVLLPAAGAGLDLAAWANATELLAHRMYQCEYTRIAQSIYTNRK